MKNPITSQTRNIKHALSQEMPVHLFRMNKQSGLSQGHEWKKIIRLLPVVLLFLILSGCTNAPENPSQEPAASTRQLFQLKIYTFSDENQESITDDYLEKAYLPGLKRHGIENIGVFKPVPGEDNETLKTYVLIPFDECEPIFSINKQLFAEQEFQEAGKAYLNAAHDQPPYERIESIVMKSFEYMPVIGVPDLDAPVSERIYELRSYQSATEADLNNKVEMFNQGGEIEIFKELDFNPVFFGKVISGPDMPNLMYMTSFSDNESRDEHWDAFRESPAWEKLKAEPKYQNNVSHIDRYFLHPTAFSDL